MAIEFYVYNEVENSVAIASSENASFPLENLKDARRTKVFRSNSNSDNIVFDLGSFRPVDAICMVGHTFHGMNLSSLTVEFNSVNNWTSPIASINVPIDYNNNIAILDFTEVTCRYVRLVMTSTVGYCEIGKLFIGKKSTYTDVDFSYPLTYQLNDLSQVSKNRYGQRFIDEIGVQRLIKAKVDFIAKPYIDDFLNWLGIVSNTKPFFINFNNGQIATDMNKFNGYYFLNTEPNLTLTSGNFWSLDLTLEEAN